MSNRKYSLLDELLSKVDNSIKTLTVGANQAARVLPKTQNNITLDEKQRKHIAGLMRINHTGEVCAQALYQGQALTAKNREVREAMQIAADEEIDHLVWCEKRLEELDSHTSYLGPIFYGLSFGIGALTGAISDKVSLGFVEATEDQVCKHLQDHLQQVPESDEKTRAILAQMLIDEASHAEMALEQGGMEFPKPVKSAMTLLSKVMTKATYHI
jgi:ubiquinone biosynthesis monooxygenase Coq7